MIEQRGVVVSLAGDRVEVETERRSSCGGCAANGACGTGILERYLGRRPTRLVAQNRAGAAVGDQVMVGVSQRGLLRAAVVGYLLPVLGLIGGAIFGQRLGGSHAEGLSVLGAAAGFALALYWLRRYSAESEHDPERQAVVLRRMSVDSVRVQTPHTHNNFSPAGE